MKLESMALVNPDMVLVKACFNEMCVFLNTVSMWQRSLCVSVCLD